MGPRQEAASGPATGGQRRPRLTVPGRPSAAVPDPDLAASSLPTRHAGAPQRPPYHHGPDVQPGASRQSQSASPPSPAFPFSPSLPAILHRDDDTPRPLPAGSPLPVPDDTLSSLSSAAEEQDLRRISRLLAAGRGPSFNAPNRESDPAPAAAALAEKFPEHRLVQEALRDQHRLEAARRAQPVDLAKPSLMIRRRTATGEEVVEGSGNRSVERAPVGFNDPLLKRGSEAALRDFPGGPLKVTPKKEPHVDKYEPTRPRESLLNAASNLAQPPPQRPSGPRRLIFGSGGPDIDKLRGKDEFDRQYEQSDQTDHLVDWLEAGNQTPEEAKKNRGTLSRGSSAHSRPRGLGIENGPSPPSSEVSQRHAGGERSHYLARKTSRESFKSHQDRPTASRSLIPKPSPTPSKSSSGFEKKAYSSATAPSSAEGRKTLGRTPSISSLKSAASLKSSASLKSTASLRSTGSLRSAGSATASLHRDSLRSGNSLRSRGTSASTSPEKSKPTRQLPNEKEKHKASNTTPTTLQRSESAPNHNKEARSTAIDRGGARSISPTHSVNPTTTEGSDRAGAKVDGEKQQEEDMGRKPSVYTLFNTNGGSGSPVPTRDRGNSIDSVFTQNTFPSANGDMNSPALSSSGWLKRTDTPYGEQSSERSVLRSPTLSDYDELANHAANESKADPNASPLYDRSTGLPNAIPTPPKSRLEDSDTDEGALEILMRDSRDFDSLLNPQKTDDDDTFVLLGGSNQYDPEANRMVRSKEETLAADRENYRSQAVQDRLMRRLKTLQLEVGRARRGIEIVERRLTGVNSDDESEWVDEDEADAMNFDIKERLRREKVKRRKSLRAAPVATHQQAPTRRLQTVVGWGIIVFQLLAIWLLVEIALYYQTFPPSASTVPLDVSAIPTFGSQVLKIFTTPIIYVFRIISWIGQTFIVNVVLFFASLVAGFFSFLWSGVLQSFSGLWAPDSRQGGATTVVTDQTIVDDW